MTVIPGSGQSFDGAAETTIFKGDANPNTLLAGAYLQTYQGPHDAPAADSMMTAPLTADDRQQGVARAVGGAHQAGHAPRGRRNQGRRLRRRRTRRFRTRATGRHGSQHDADGLRRGPPAPHGRRLPRHHESRLPRSARPGGQASRHAAHRRRRDRATRGSRRAGSTSSWRRRSNPEAVAEAAKLLPDVLADARQVAVDSAMLNATLVSLANALDADRTGHFPGYDRRDVAALLRWLAEGHFVLLGYQRCSVQDGQAEVDPDEPTRRAAVARRGPRAADGQRRSARAGAVHHAEFSSLRRLPVHRRGPREHRWAGQGARAQIRRVVHGGGDELQRA